MLQQFVSVCDFFFWEYLWLLLMELDWLLPEGRLQCVQIFMSVCVCEKCGKHSPVAAVVAAPKNKFRKD